MSTGGLRTADYEFDLPPDRIAQTPAEHRDESRLMIVDRTSGAISHGRFRDIATIIPAGDTLVLNTTRVLKARLFGTRETGGKAEILLIEPRLDGTWEALVRPGAKIRDGQRITIAPNVSAVISTAPSSNSSLSSLDSGPSRVSRVVRFESDLNADEIMFAYGHIPLPPYMHRPDGPEDAARYQTVYADAAGSVAAPTAGLHFTQELLAQLEAKGVHRADVLLHVGPGTFRPVDADDPAQHAMHSERFVFAPETAERLNQARATGHTIWAVGTTALRTLETVVDGDGRFASRAGATSIFIRPPHRVRGADHLITNFHLPRSTLLMLVAAFAGFDLMRRAYEVAIAEGYRFYSYGDAMCII